MNDLVQILVRLNAGMAECYSKKPELALTLTFPDKLSAICAKQDLEDNFGCYSRFFNDTVKMECGDTQLVGVKLKFKYREIVEGEV